MSDNAQLARLVVSLEARIGAYEKALAKADGDTKNTFARMRQNTGRFESDFKRMERGISSSVTAVTRAFGVLGIAMSGRAIIDMTSAWTDLNSRVNNAAGSMERGGAVMDQLAVMARRTYSSITQTTEAYLGNSQALTALGYSTQSQLDLVEALNNSLVISATRGQAAQSVMDAWSKAMAEGRLSGQNLNTVIASGGRLSKALADSMGVSVNELRALGSEGKITTDVMFNVTDQLATLRAEAEAMPATVSDGFVLLRDSIFKFVGQADEAIGASTELAEAIVRISDAINSIPDQSAFDRFFGWIGDNLITESDVAQFEALVSAVDYFSTTSPDQVLLDFQEAMGSTIRDAEEFELALADAEQAMANLGMNTKGMFGEVDAAAQDLFDQILRGRGTVESATDAIEELARVNPTFADLKSSILQVVEHLFMMRDAAVAARLAADTTTTDLGAFPSRRAFNRAFGPDLSNDGGPRVPPRPSVPTGRGSRSSAASEVERQKKAVNDLIESLEHELSVVHKSALQREIEQKLRRHNVDIASAEGKRIAELTALIEHETKIRENSAEQMRAIAQSLGNVLGDVFTDATKDFDAFLDNVMSGFADIGRQNINSLFNLENWANPQTGAALDGAWIGPDGYAKILGDAVKAGAQDGSKTGIFGGLGQLLGGNTGSMLSAGLGGVGIGYQAQSPLMGGLGGALSGFAAGGPVGAVVGGLGGIIGEITSVPLPPRPLDQEQKEAA